jgi:hypothetical protein
MQKNIAPSSTIYSDCWKAYGSLDELGYKHYTINHSEHYKDSEAGVHTNNIESNWRPLKRVLPCLFFETLNLITLQGTLPQNNLSFFRIERIKLRWGIRNSSQIIQNLLKWFLINFSQFWTENFIL